MEAVADYGAMSYFGVQTMTTGIYRAWLSMGDRMAAVQLSAALLGKWVEKVGPKVSGITAGAFYGVGILGSGLAVQLQSMPLFLMKTRLLSI